MIMHIFESELTIEADLFYKSKDNDPDIDSHYICLICLGVIVDPIECKQCDSLYCKRCLKKNSLKCPKRCDKKQYGKPNRFVMDLLNQTRFRCPKS